MTPAERYRASVRDFYAAHGEPPPCPRPGAADTRTDAERAACVAWWAAWWAAGSAAVREYEDATREERERAFVAANPAKKKAKAVV